MTFSQNEAILKHLECKGSITPLEALNLFGCFRLGARIFDLREAGYNIKTEIIINNGKRFAKYILNK